MPHHFAGKIEMPIQAGADGGSAERELAQNFDRFFARALSVIDLLRVTGKFLAEPHRRRIHQMGAADLDDVPEFLRFRVERVLQFLQRRNETVSSIVRPR